MQEAIGRCRLNLSGYTVLTEAASGAYQVTPVMAAMAGAAAVFAIARTTRYGSVEQIASQIASLASVAGVTDAIKIVSTLTCDVVGGADIVTNSGHIRPIDTRFVSWMKETAVIALMYEDWEYRATDVDLQTCRSRGIRVVATNEKHPAVDVFSFLGPMAAKLLNDAGVAVYDDRILLVCSNPFSTFIASGLNAFGGAVDSVSAVREGDVHIDYDAILIAQTPGTEGVLDSDDIAWIARYWRASVVAIFWGDVDRDSLQAAGLHYWPLDAPAPGHMGILPSDIGPEPIVRLQAGSLKAAEAALRHRNEQFHPDHNFGTLM